MFKKKKKDSSSGVIRPGASGNPNEVNFSVLEAKSQEVPEKESPAWEIPTKEVKTRKHRRRRSRVLATVGILIGCFAAIGLVVFFTVQGFRHHLDYVGQLHEATTQITQQAASTEPFNDAVESAINQPLSELADKQEIKDFPSQEQKVRIATDEMLRAKERIEQLQQNLINPVDVENANNAIALVNAQQKVRDIGSAFMGAALPYIEQYRNTKDVYDLVISGDSDAREAVFLTGDATDETMNEAIPLSESSINNFKQVKDRVEPLLETYPNLQPLTEYLQKRIDAQYAAIETDRAYLEKNSAKMRDANERYNGLEQDAAALMTEGSILWPTDAIDAAFNEMRANSMEAASWKVEYPTWQDLRTLLTS